MTDKERLDFLQNQDMTFWVGFSTSKSRTSWPVFTPKNDLRKQIDIAINSKETFAIRDG